MDRAIDGKLTLVEQEQTVRLAEAAGPFITISYTKGVSVPPGVVNRLSLIDAPLGTDIKPLALLLVKPTQSFGSLIDEQTQAGKRLVFISQVFVEGNELLVAGFR